MPDEKKQLSAGVFKFTAYPLCNRDDFMDPVAHIWFGNHLKLSVNLQLSV